MKLDESNSKIFNGLRIATQPDENGAYIAEFLDEAIPTIPSDKKAREEAFDAALSELKTAASTVKERFKGFKELAAKL